jgi:hypothetical protein
MVICSGIDGLCLNGTAHGDQRSCGCPGAHTPAHGAGAVREEAATYRRDPSLSIVRELTDASPHPLRVGVIAEADCDAGGTLIAAVARQSAG